ncbi:tyrosine-type recombinase/integrase [Sinorhizobium meliloti]|nr:integrase [Sinorhizobium meliloti]MDW9702929.1 tyrosine-type recombinase/integrase [Sinorhizobium meliloti]MDW9932238.1 tyrosine-type recombinase/integrase [Sinorhizobium meliloti]MDX0099055.1 tyrosine-type recombinase/integrase [Sinorhizobium meliloti]MDX0117970.1 tyrosine-type recombinase/integrase [Sinorhizobium meliloti]
MAVVEVQERFDEHRRTLARQQEPALLELTPDQLKHIEDVYYWHLLDEDEELRLSELDDADFEELSELIALGEEVGGYELARGKMFSPFTESEAAEVLTWSSVDLKLDKASPSWPRLYRAIQTATVRAAQAKRQRSEGLPVETPPEPQTNQRVDKHLASTLIGEWVAEKSRAKGGWTPATAAANKLWTERFVEMASDRPIGDYGKSDAREFKTALLSLPPNWTKIKGLEKLAMKEAAKRAAELKLAPMSGKNVNKVLGFVRAFWNWAKANYDVPSNPFDGLNVKISGKARDERHPFALAELSAIFKSPIYTGCQSVRYHNSPGDLIPSDNGIYWVPLVGLFTGCRSGEIIQLRTEDVKIEGGIAYIEVTDDGEDLSLKNSGSRRRIPVHRTLKEIGFLRFAERQRKLGHKRLFPDFPKAKDGTYSTAYSRKFSNLLKALEVKHDKISFHSFRHTFEDACRNSRIPLDFVNALQGHAQQGMAGRYGSGLYGLKLLAEEMGKLEYDMLDLSHLLKPDRALTAREFIDATE